MGPSRPIFGLRLTRGEGKRLSLVGINGVSYLNGELHGSFWRGSIFE